jgi:hypothetical protein
MPQVTDADATEFAKCLRAWQVKLGLQDWRIVLSPIAAKKSMAEMDKWDWLQRQVTCRLGRDWKSTPVNSTTIEQTAVHELLHVLLFELIETARNPTSSHEDIGSVEHRVINTLEQLLVPGD